MLTVPAGAWVATGTAELGGVSLGALRGAAGGGDFAAAPWLSKAGTTRKYASTASTATMRRKSAFCRAGLSSTVTARYLSRRNGRSQNGTAASLPALLPPAAWPAPPSAACAFDSPDPPPPDR